MLDYDSMCHALAPVTIRYADNVLLAVSTIEEAQAAKWRTKNNWWYDLQLRNKNIDTNIISLSTRIDFCGYVVHRFTYTSHNKGCTFLRQRTLARALNCNNIKSWPSYFGLLKQADCYNIIKQIK